MQHLVNEVQLQFMLYIIHSKDLGKKSFSFLLFLKTRNRITALPPIWSLHNISWKIKTISKLIILLQTRNPQIMLCFSKVEKNPNVYTLIAIFLLDNLKNIKSLTIIEVLLITHYSGRFVSHSNEGFDGFLIAHKTKVMTHRFTDRDLTGFYTFYCILLMKAILMLSLREKNSLSDIPVYLLWLLIGKQQFIYPLYQVCSKYLFYSYMF